MIFSKFLLLKNKFFIINFSLGIMTDKIITQEHQKEFKEWEKKVIDLTINQLIKALDPKSPTDLIKKMSSPNFNDTLLSIFRQTIVENAKKMLSSLNPKIISWVKKKNQMTDFSDEEILQIFDIEDWPLNPKRLQPNEILYRILKNIWSPEMQKWLFNEFFPNITIKDIRNLLQNRADKESEAEKIRIWIWLPREVDLLRASKLKPWETPLQWTDYMNYFMKTDKFETRKKLYNIFWLEENFNIKYNKVLDWFLSKWLITSINSLRLDKVIKQATESDKQYASRYWGLEKFIALIINSSDQEKMVGKLNYLYNSYKIINIDSLINNTYIWYIIREWHIENIKFITEWDSETRNFKWFLRWKNISELWKYHIAMLSVCDISLLKIIINRFDITSMSIFEQWDWESILKLINERDQEKKDKIHHNLKLVLEIFSANKHIELWYLLNPKIRNVIINWNTEILKLLNWERSSLISLKRKIEEAVQWYTLNVTEASRDRDQDNRDLERIKEHIERINFPKMDINKLASFNRTWEKTEWSIRSEISLSDLIIEWDVDIFSLCILFQIKQNIDDFYESVNKSTKRILDAAEKRQVEEEANDFYNFNIWNACYPEKRTNTANSFDVMFYKIIIWWLEFKDVLRYMIWEPTARITNERRIEPRKVIWTTFAKSKRISKKEKSS